ncbi:MAG: V-type ATP synthase subunit F [Peptostreptococcaceae bacterium]|nr:V-type ATP synthase subunit F [Peptostreptococcaceae bacterium]MDY5739481.1 V-type ATP synthase subunit F [Anaerovoracaceae bacterium]SFE16962.1 V/A-type H+-transporting ATPase subunit F [Peptostreptococcaceae bacterium pGA-8]
MYKIGVIGDRESVMGFKALGLDVFPCDDSESGRKTLHNIAKSDYAIIYITEGLAYAIRSDIDEYNDSKLPAIIPIPGRDGATGRGMDSVRKSVERAVGADILFGGNK